MSTASTDPLFIAPTLVLCTLDPASSRQPCKERFARENHGSGVDVNPLNLSGWVRVGKVNRDPGVAPRTEETMIVTTPPLDSESAHLPERSAAGTVTAAGTGAPTAPTGDHHQSNLAERIRRFADGEYRQVVATVALWSGSVDEATDAVADALGQAWEKLDSGESVDNLAAFVTTCAMNRIRARFRRRALWRRKRHLLVVTDARESDNGTVERRLDLVRAMNTLSARQREIVALHYGADLSIDQIAERLGIAPGTVKATLHHARSLLARELGSDEKGPTDG